MSDSPTGRHHIPSPPLQNVPDSLADALQWALEKGTDVHTHRAAQMFGVAPEDVTRDQRRAAKTATFREYYSPVVLGHMRRD